MRVCFISKQYPPRVGGIGRFTAELASGFAGAGHEAHVISCDDYPAESHTLEDGVQVHRIPEIWPAPPELEAEASYPDLARLAIVYRELSRLNGASPFDLVSSPIWLAEGLLAALDPRWASILSLHTETKTLARVDSHWRENGRGPALMRLEALAVTTTRHTHAATAASLARVGDDYGPPRGAFVIPHGVRDRSRGTPRGRDRTGGVRVLVVGRLDERKGGDLLAEVLPPLLERHGDLEVVLAGEAVRIGGSRTVEEMIGRRCADRADLMTRIRFLGVVSDQDLSRQYADADILLFPSREESFGLPLIEAMSFGLPAVACAAGGVAEVVADGETGRLVGVGDVGGLIAAVSELASDCGERQRMGLAARDRYLCRFSPEATLPRVIDAYSNVVAQERGRIRSADRFDAAAAFAPMVEENTRLDGAAARRVAGVFLGEAPPARPSWRLSSPFARLARSPRRAQPAGHGPRRTAIVWLTHFQDEEAADAFQRLRREASGHGDVYCACHGAAQLDGVGGRPIRIGDRALRAALPSRWREWRNTGAKLNDFVDLLHFSLIRRLPRYDDYWFVEYDVDFSGHWGRLFSAFEGCRADLLGTTLHPRRDDPDWYFWPRFRPGEDASAEHHARGFFPIVRLSRRFAETYGAHVAGGWAGHFEALYPSLALAHGLAVEDIGGDGPLVPAERRGRFYSNAFRDEHLAPGSFRFQPPIARHYYQAGASEFPQPDFLWHPIKTAAADPGRP